MAENTHLENDKTGNAQLEEQNKYNMENDRKYTHWKIAGSLHLENDRTENAQHWK